MILLNWLIVKQAKITFGFLSSFCIIENQPNIYSLVYNFEKKTIVLFHKWVNVDSDFKMPIDIYVGNKLTRVYPTAETQEIDLPKNTEEFIVDKLHFYMTIEEMKIEDFSGQ